MPAKAVIFSLQQAYLVWTVGTGSAGGGAESALHILEAIVLLLAPPLDFQTFRRPCT